MTDRSGLDAFLDYLDNVVVWTVVKREQADTPEFTYVSSGFEKIWGRPPEALLDDFSMLIDSVHPEDRERALAAMEEVRESNEAGNGELPMFEHRVVRPDGGIRWVEVRSFTVPADADGPSTLVGITIDITDQKRAERELRRKNDQLEEFASVVSHDLKNPLNVATGYLGLAQDECGSDHLDTVGSAHDRMRRLITDILALAREGGETGDLEPITLAEFSESCWGTVATSDATLVCDLERTIRADRTQLRRLLENLIRNAIEHGGETVTVTIGGVETGFSVEDDGPGIPEEEREHVFERGYSTAEEGTGFGLAIVKQIVDAHGWDVAVKAGREGETRFEITGVNRRGG